MSLEEGCRMAVETCMGVKPKDRVSIIADGDSKRIGNELKEIALEITPHVRFFNLDIYGRRPLKKFPKIIENAARNSTVTFWTAKSVEGELETIRGPFLRSAVINGRHAHMVNITEEIVNTGLSADYLKVEEFTKDLYNRALKAEEVRIKTEKGTDLKAKVGKYKWVASTGIVRGFGSWHNLPSGEIYTTPERMEGKAVIDGTLGDYFDSIYHYDILEETPVILEIKSDAHGAVLSKLECENEDLKKDLNDYLHQHDCSKRVGELGIGTNIFIKGLINNILQDEKHPGAHIAFGDPNSGMTMAGWSCGQHIDMVIQRSNIWFDDEKIMEEGEFIF